MKLSAYQSLDPHLLVGMVNTELRNNAADLEDLCKTHAIDEGELRVRLAAAGYEYRPEQRQFR